jgi:hypothetical protein
VAAAAVPRVVLQAAARQVDPRVAHRPVVVQQVEVLEVRQAEVLRLLAVQWAVRLDRRVPKVAAAPRGGKRVPTVRMDRRVHPAAQQVQAAQAAAVLRAPVARQAAAHSRPVEAPKVKMGAAAVAAR